MTSAYDRWVTTDPNDDPAWDREIEKILDDHPKWSVERAETFLQKRQEKIEAAAEREIEAHMQDDA